MDLDKTASIINKIGDSFNKDKHFYLSNNGSDYKAIENKNEKASFIKVTKVVKDLLNSNISSLTKTEVLKSFEKITIHFENKPRGLFETLFYGLFNIYYIWSAKSLIADFQDKLQVINRTCENLDAIMQEFTIRKTIDPTYAKNFILARDSTGKTLVRHFCENPDNIQKETIQPLLNGLGSELLRECLFAPDEDELTPIDVAIWRGQMGVIATLLPIPPKEDFSPLSEIEKQSLANGLKKLLSILANSNESKKHLKKCPTGMNYDKMNHILSCLHALVCYRVDLSSAQNSIKEESKNLPLAIRLLIEASTSQSSFTEFEKLCKECTSLTTLEEVNKKMTDWKYELPKYETKISLSTALQANSTNKLLGIIEKIATNQENKNDYHYYLSFLLNPMASYDQKVDFSDPTYQSILHEVIDIALKNPTFLEKDAFPILEALILKHPDFLEGTRIGKNTENQDIKGQNIKGQDIKEYLEEIIQSSENKENAEKFLKAIIEISKGLHSKIFSILTKKNLKYFLEAKGRALREPQIVD